MIESFVSWLFGTYEGVMTFLGAVAVIGITAGWVKFRKHGD